MSIAYSVKVEIACVRFGLRKNYCSSTLSLELGLRNCGDYHVVTNRLRKLSDDDVHREGEGSKHNINNPGEALTSVQSIIINNVMK